MDLSSACTRLRPFPVPASGLRFAGGSWSGPEGRSGWNPSQDAIRRFTFSFPDQENRAARSPEVLIVEDSAADIGLLREVFQEHRVNCEVTVVINGERAIQFVDEIDAGERTCPDLILLDLNLPKRPGKDVLKRIRESKVCGQAPVVILTSSDNQRDKDDVAPFHPSRYVRKPSGFDEFMQLGELFKRMLYPKP